MVSSHLLVLGARADVSLHYVCLVAPAPGPGSYRNVTDPRDWRGVRHSLFTVLSLAVTGVLAGCRSLTAIWEHATDLTPSDLRSLGLEAGPGPALGSHPFAGSCRTWTPPTSTPI